MSYSGSLRVGLVGFFIAASLCLAGPASADNLQDCIDQGNAQGIQFPTCTETDGKLVPTAADDGTFGSDGGFGATVGVLAFVMVVAVIAIAIGRVSTARRLARESGMDPDVATGMALLEDNGLSATYLAASLRPPGSAPVASTGPPSAADRLGELKRLLDGGLVTQAEYDERRKAIIDAV